MAQSTYSGFNPTLTVQFGTTVAIEPNLVVTDTNYTDGAAHERYTVTFSGFTSGFPFGAGGDTLSATPTTPPGGGTGGGTSCGSSGTYASNTTASSSSATAVTAAALTSYFDSFTFQSAVVTSTPPGGGATTTTSTLHDATVTFADDNGSGAPPVSATVTLHIVPQGNALTVASGTTTVVTNVQQYTGKTLVSGELDIRAGGDIRASQQVALKASGAVFDVSGAGGATIQELSGVAGSSIRLGSGVLSLTESVAATYSGVITDGGFSGGIGAGLVVGGTAPLTLAGVETYTGKTQITGELDLAQGGSLASSAQVALKAAGAVFDVSGASAGGPVVINTLSGVAGSTIKLGGGALQLTQNAAATFSGVIADGGAAGGTGGSLVVNGAQPLTLAGVETYTGKTQVFGHLNLAAGASLAASQQIALKADGAVFDVSGAGANGGIVHINELSGVANSTIELGSAILALNETVSASYSGVIADGGVAGGTGGALFVNGTATLTLSGANTFTGGVYLRGGTLELASTTAAGVGHALTFSGAATLQLDGGALSGSGAQQSYGTTIANFGTTDHIDLASIAYVAGATSSYDGSTLTVTSGANQVALTLTGVPSGTAFVVSDDGHGHALVSLVGVL